MSMAWTIKALDMIVGANLIPQDLSRTVTMQDGRPRPFLENTPVDPNLVAKAEIHDWNEQGLILPGSGAASYKDGDTPPDDAQAPTRGFNACCNVGKTAKVTDNFVAALTRNNTIMLADGQLEKSVTSALDFQVELKTREVLDECEWMHISGDQTITAGFPGGQCDGLTTWIQAGKGAIVYDAGSSGTPVNVAEAFVKHTMRTIAEGFPSFMPTVMLTPPEGVADINGFIGSGAQNPIVRIIPADGVSQNLVAGSPRVSKYDSGYGVLDVRVEPNLSPLFNPLLSGHAYFHFVLYNEKAVANAPLRNLQAEQLARLGTSLSKMVTTTFTQEYRNPKHAAIIRYLKSAIA